MSAGAFLTTPKPTPTISVFKFFVTGVVSYIKMVYDFFIHRFSSISDRPRDANAASTCWRK
jgi:hypothetical protein